VLVDELAKCMAYHNRRREDIEVAVVTAYLQAIPRVIKMPYASFMNIDPLKPVDRRYDQRHATWLNRMRGQVAVVNRALTRAGMKATHYFELHWTVEEKRAVYEAMVRPPRRLANRLEDWRWALWDQEANNTDKGWHMPSLLGRRNDENYND
jgi:hypothetical protein